MRRRVPSHLWGDYPGQLAYFTQVLANGCWEFTGYILPTGYGQLGRNIGAHRVAWEVANGRPVPAGLVVDHECHNRDPQCLASMDCPHRRCVNANHLEAVPSGVNVMRGKGIAPANAAVERCPEGHAYTPENTYYRPDRFGRMCRQCRYEAGVRSAQLNREHIRDVRRADRRRAKPLDFAIREWAMRSGLPCTMHGVIPTPIRQAYAAAHQDVAA